MSDAMVSGMFLRFRLRQSAVLSPNIVATEQSVGGALTASDDRQSVKKHIVQIYKIRAVILVLSITAPVHSIVHLLHISKLMYR